METILRPLTRKQRAELAGPVSFWIGALRVTVFLLVAAVVAILLRSIVEAVHRGASFLWWAVPALMLMTAVYLWAKRGTGGRELRRKLRADLAQGMAAVRRFEVVDAIEIEEREDEGPGFFLRTADDEVYLFAGQYLDAPKRKGFPWTSFEILEAPTSLVFFGLKRLGNPLPPSAVRGPLSGEEHRRFGGDRFRRLDVGFETLKAEAPAVPWTDPKRNRGCNHEE